MGAVRAVAQTISYEVSIALVFMIVIVSAFSFDFSVIVSSQCSVWFLFLLCPAFFMWFVRRLAETNRAPFDLAEGESELVSGFNIEYGGIEFAFLFIAEYGSILFMRLVTSVLFLGGFFQFFGFLLLVEFLFVCYLFLWVRGSYPRMRYDTLMYLTWKSFLSLVLSFLCIFIPLMCF